MKFLFLSVICLHQEISNSTEKKEIAKRIKYIKFINA